MKSQSICALVLWLWFAGVQALPAYTVIDERMAQTTQYDFIIVGGGISGLVLGNRLSENPNIKVLTIEAGPFDQRQNGILVPGDWDPTPYLWPNLNTQPLTGLNNRTETVVCAKLVGGGSTVNAMNWIRGAQADYNDWASLGNSGWDWNGMFPNFLKSENFSPVDQSYAMMANISWNNSVRSTTGMVKYSYPNTFYPGSGNFWAAAQSVGFKQVLDPNGGMNPGLFWPPTVLNTTNYTRSDARQAYYEGVKGCRPNWQVLANTTVQKITFSGTRATGVEFIPTAGGAVSCASALREVIVAAGALHTPQVLQLSGIGSKYLLQSMNIPVISDLPGVGSNLQDQANLVVQYNMTKNLFPNVDSLANNATYNSQQLAAYLAHNPSSYTIVKNQSTNFLGVSLTQVDGYQSIISDAASRDGSGSLPANVDPTVLQGYKAQRALILKEYSNPNISSGIFFWDTNKSLTVVALKPLSRGNVTIKSTNVLTQPTLDYRTATDPDDLKVLTALFKKIRQVFAAPPLQALGAIEVTPGPTVQSDSQIIAALQQQLVVSSAHQCCSAPMMPQSMGGVCNASRNVYGTQGLRVGDVSAFPFAVSAGPTPSVYAAAEKLAAMIKAQYNI